MMLYQHVNLVLKPDHAGFDAFQASLKSFHVAPLLFEEQLYAELVAGPFLRLSGA